MRNTTATILGCGVGMWLSTWLAFLPPLNGLSAQFVLSYFVLFWAVYRFGNERHA